MSTARLPQPPAATQAPSRGRGDRCRAGLGVPPRGCAVAGRRCAGGDHGRLSGSRHGDDGVAEAAQERYFRGREADHLWEVAPARRLFAVLDAASL
jgi:hypothetical protein